MALPARFIEQEIERQPPRRSGREIDRAFLLDRACGCLVMKSLVEVVDDP